MTENEKILQEIVSEESCNSFLNRYINYLYQAFNKIKEDCKIEKHFKFTIWHITNLKFHEWNDDIWNFLKIKYANNSLGLLNWMLDTFSKIKISRWGEEYFLKDKLEYEYQWIGEFINVMLNNLKYYSLTFDEEKYQIVSTEHSHLLEKINNETLNDLIYKIKSSTDIKTKTSFMLTFAKNMLHHLYSNSENWKYLEKTFNVEFLNNLREECNGYFRHTPMDKGKKEKSIEWVSFTSEEKNKIIDQTLTYYLSILSVLKDNVDNFNFEIF